MKLVAILSLVMMISAVACTREADQLKADSAHTLQGKWKFQQFYIDPGNGSGTWQPAPQGQTYIEFKADGTLGTDVGMFASLTSYEVKDDHTVVLRSASQEFEINYKIESEQLELNPMCVEGCGYKFTRLQ